MIKNTLATLHQVDTNIILGLLISESNDEIWKSIVHSIEADIRSKN
jgi:hypothetical protein